MIFLYLYQPTKGYAYNSDSIFLYDFIASFKPKGRVLDVGCGVGIVSLLITRDFKTDTSVIDKQDLMLKYAMHNYALNHLKVEPFLGDFTEFKVEEKFDFVVSNPPFYDSSVTQSENKHLNIARYAHHLPIEPFVVNVKKLLKPRGRFIFCYDAKQIDRLLHALKEHKINPEILRFVHSKIDRDSKLVMISARMNSKSLMRILPPLIVFDETNHYTKEASTAFIKAGTNSIKGDYDVTE